jgi:uncharacterized protein (TIGR00290 family)
VSEKIILAFSSGKDSALALYEVRRLGQYEVGWLLTTMTEDYDRVSMHGVRRELVCRQADEIGLPLKIVWIPKSADNALYEARMAAALAELKAQGASAVAFGDIFLEDLRKYRQDKLAQAGLKAVFPIWKRDTRALAEQFIAEGFKAVVTCVDTQVLDGRFAGREYDRPFLDELPKGIDPCGENGEFHSFCYAGPIFRPPRAGVACLRGQIVLREGRFNFCDLLPG